MIPLLDTLQSIPVLSFLPGVMLAMVALFPSRQVGIELGSILLIFSGQAWNMAFSFYSSLKSIPSEMHEVAEPYIRRRAIRHLEKGRIVIEVEDRGPGVPAVERRSIFRAFRRGRQSDVTGGVGLGLALARRWAGLLDGRLALASPAEGGACFRVELGK